MTTTHAAHSSPSILVVNDDPVQLHTIAGILARDGMQVERCTGAEAALNVLATRQDFDAIVTDLRMPGIDGWRFCRLLRSPEYAAFNSTPILVVSATYCGADAEQITADLGANAFLSAPFEAPTLRQCMAELLDGKAPRAARRVLIVAERDRPCSTLRTAFEAHGCTVSLAATPEQGLERFLEESPEVVVLDYDMPGLTNHHLLRRIRAPGSSTAVVVITSDPGPARAAESMRQGADAHVRKPFDPEYVITLCEKARRERALLRVEELLEERTLSLRDSEARFRSLVDGIVEIILVCNADGVIKYVNEVGAQRLAWPSAELVGKSLQSILPPDGTGGTAADLLATGDGVFVEAVYWTRNGSRIDVEVSHRPIVFENKPAVMTVARDVTERKRAQEEKSRLEDQLRVSQKMEAIGTLAGGVAHDFNNLLAVIMGHVQLLKMRTAPEDPAFEHASTIETVVYRAKGLTDQLLGFARRGKHQNTLVNVRAMIREVMSFLSRTFDKKIVLREEGEDEHATIMGDPGQLHQVLLNLSVNARDAMPGGGTIVYRTELIRPDDEFKKAHPRLMHDQYVMVSVSDTGTGIPEHIKDRIFEPFFTTKDARSGTGMGLAMVYGIVHNHGGEIEVETAEGQGTTFTLYLPFATRAERPVEAKPAEQLVAGTGKILLVEDEELVRKVAATLLKHLGYQVETAADGREAVDYYRGHWREVSLVVLDMIMPLMDGRECFRALRSVNPYVKVVLVTGYDQNHAAQGLLDEGVQRFIQKPYELAAFSRVIAEAINAPANPGVAHSR